MYRPILFGPWDLANQETQPIQTSLCPPKVFLPIQGGYHLHPADLCHLPVHLPLAFLEAHPFQAVQHQQFLLSHPSAPSTLGDRLAP